MTFVNKKNRTVSRTNVHLWAWGWLVGAGAPTNRRRSRFRSAGDESRGAGAVEAVRALEGRRMAVAGRGRFTRAHAGFAQMAEALLTLTHGESLLLGL